MAFKVVIADGPAQGWSYITLVAPDRKIGVAPSPREDETSPRRWMRVLLEEGAEPWPNQVVYERGPIPDRLVMAQFRDENGDFEVPYHLDLASLAAGTGFTVPAVRDE